MIENEEAMSMSGLGRLLRLVRGRVSGVVPSIYGEDYDEHWGFCCFEDKTVLDLGADYGSTAHYFLRRGARRVVAVEGSSFYSFLLKLNFMRNRSVVCVGKRLSRPMDFEELIVEHGPDVVKVDVEGAERHLLGVSKVVVSSVGEWLVETNSYELYEKFATMFSLLGYEIENHYVDLHPRLRVVIYAYHKNQKVKAGNHEDS